MKTNSKPKITYIHIVQGYYDKGIGWEDVHATTSRTEAQARLREYRQNAPQFRYRLVTRPERS